VDVGAGDGGYVLYRARTDTNTLAIAIDASPDCLADGAWRAKRARLANATFLVEGVERLPRELAGVADEVAVHFPWGSLLRGLVDAASSVVGSIAGVMKSGAELRVLLSAVDRDGFIEVTPSAMTSRRPAYAEHGLHLIEARWASDTIVAESHSAWAKRLGVGRTRQAVIARYRRDAT
jgi:16S rRNA (adenine(1408)-N(1))-methyltransferase